MNVLQVHFLPSEIHNISLNMLTVLESYTPDEQASIRLFHETYAKTVTTVAKQHSSEDAICILLSKREKIDN